MRPASVAVAVVALVAGPALADENSGLYVGAGFGDFSTEFEDVGDVDIDFKEDSDASKLFGGWRFNKFMAVQLDVIDFGDAGVAVGVLDIEADTRGVAPSFVATLPLGSIELFAKAGMLFYDVEVTVANDPVVDDSGEELVYGAGIGFTMLGRLSLRAEYDVIEISEVDDAEAVFITAAWRF